MAKVGRNDPCHCGSGRKFKRCCEAKTATQRSERAIMIILGVLMVGAVAAGVAAFRSDGQRGGVRVWDSGHGHYHDASGKQVP